jgi:hypothetical protein
MCLSNPQPPKPGRKNHADIQGACPAMASRFMAPIVGRLCRPPASLRWVGATIGRRLSHRSAIGTRMRRSGGRPPCPSAAPIARNFPTLWDKKDFVRVGIFYFGARRKPADIDVALIRRVRAGHKSRLIRNRNAIGEITFGRPRCRRSRGLWRRVLFRGLRWRRRLVWIVGLCYRFFWGTWITRHAMTHRRLIIRA